MRVSRLKSYRRVNFSFKVSVVCRIYSITAEVGQLRFRVNDTSVKINGNNSAIVGNFLMEEGGEEEKVEIEEKNKKNDNNKMQKKGV